MAEMKAPKAPAGLGAAGRKLWRESLRPRADGSQLHLRPDELLLLEQACRLADDLAALRERLEGEPLTVPGSKGQSVAHPLRAEIHRSLASLDRILRTLALPDAPGRAVDGTEKSDMARQLARQRWRGRSA